MFNQCTFMGRMANDPQLQTTKTGKPVCSFRFAVNTYSSKTEEKKADFFSMEAWGAQATLITDYLKKGDRVLIACRAKQKPYVTKEQESRSTVVFVVNQVVFAGDKKNVVVAPQVQIDEEDDDHLPFDLGDEE